MNGRSQSNFLKEGQKGLARTFSMGRLGSSMSNAMSGLSGMSNRNSIASGLGGFDKTRSEGKSATDDSKDKIRNRINNSIKADPMDYALMTTTIPQQARKESNFIGSAYHYNLAIDQVQKRVAGDYVVVYARPKTSQSYPRGDGVEIFDPNFQNRIEIITEKPKNNSAEATRIGYLINDKGYFGVGSLLFNGRRIDLYFEPPQWLSNKFMTPILTQTLRHHQQNIKAASLLDEVIDRGIREEGTFARFGMKHMMHQWNLPYGFYFVALDLGVWNVKTKKEDIHHIVAVKLPIGGEVASAFILKQAIDFPHNTWIKWKKHITQEELKRKGLLDDINVEESDFYEEDLAAFDRRSTKEDGFDSMDWAKYD